MPPFQEVFPNTILCCQSKEEGGEHFFELFEQEWESVCIKKGYLPLLLAANYSCSGELAETYGLFVKNDTLHEVHGSECSMWDFDGQWNLEKTTWESILHRVVKGELGEGSAVFNQNFSQELKELAIKNLKVKNQLDFKRLSLQEKMDYFGKELSIEDAFRYGITWSEDLSELFVDNLSYETRLKASYASQWKQLFKKQLGEIDFREEVQSPLKTYFFERNGLLVSAEISAAKRVTFKFATANTMNEDFSWQEVVSDIKKISDDLVLSLLENQNLFLEASPKPSASKKKSFTK